MHHSRVATAFKEVSKSVSMNVLLLLCLALLVQHTEQTKCSNGEVRLNPTLAKDHTTPRQGVVQICSDNDEWLTVCGANNERWDTHSANLVCKQLGYNGRDAVAGYTCSLHVPKYFKINECSVPDNTINDCQHQEQADCTRRDCDTENRRLASVKCAPAACTNGEIRLVNGTTNREGRVEVCRDGRWGTVCNDNQEDLAGAVCSQLGFPAEGAVTVSEGFGQGTGPIYDCSLNENNTFNCTHTTSVNCTHSMDLGVVCQTHQQVIDQIINETRQECTQPSPVTTLPMSCDECAVTDEAVNRTEQSCDTTTALGAVIGVLVVLLVAIVIGWIVSCVVLKRKSTSSKLNHSDLDDKSDIQRQLDNPVYDMNIPVQTSPIGPANQTTHRDEGAVYSYAVVDRSRKNRHPNNDSVIVSPTSDQDYHVLDHVLEQGQGGELEYEVPNSGMPPRGLEVGEGEYSTLKH